MQECLTNSVDAGASQMTVRAWHDADTYQMTRVEIQHDSQGLQTRQDVDAYFATFGFDHANQAKQGRRQHGQYGLGRAQLFAFGVVTWRTGTFRLTVGLTEKTRRWPAPFLALNTSCTGAPMTITDRFSFDRFSFVCVHCHAPGEANLPARLVDGEAQGFMSCAACGQTLVVTLSSGSPDVRRMTDEDTQTVLDVQVPDARITLSTSQVQTACEALTALRQALKTHLGNPRVRAYVQFTGSLERHVREGQLSPPVRHALASTLSRVYASLREGNDDDLAQEHLNQAPDGLHLRLDTLLRELKGTD